MRKSLAFYTVLVRSAVGACLLSIPLMVGIGCAQAPGAQVQKTQELASLSGKTIRWMFPDGPTAGITFEHTLNPDGSIVWRAVDGAFKGASQREQLYGAVRINDQTWVVSYLAASGHTLTVVLNFANHQATGFASDDKAWHQLRATFDVVN